MNRIEPLSTGTKQPKISLHFCLLSNRALSLKKNRQMPVAAAVYQNVANLGDITGKGLDITGKGLDVAVRLVRMKT